MKKQYQGKYTAPKKSLLGALRLLLLLLSGILILVLGVTAGQFGRARKVYSDLAASVSVPGHTTSEVALTEVLLPSETAALVATEETLPVTVPETTEPEPLAQYLHIWQENPDFFGWVQIPDTKINYPVMYAPDDLEKYLHMDYKGNYFYGGTPYMDVRCTPDSDNYLIYGHNMADGSMFRGLLKYENRTYWEENPVIRFDTLYETGEYQIVAAFYDRVYYSHETCFKFYNFIDAGNEAAYNEAVANYKSKSLYDTGVTPEYGDRLITLITCAYHVENGRFVVVACKA